MLVVIQAERAARQKQLLSVVFSGNDLRRLVALGQLLQQGKFKVFSRILDAFLCQMLFQPGIAAVTAGLEVVTPARIDAFLSVCRADVAKAGLRVGNEINATVGLIRGHAHDAFCNDTCGQIDGE